jgi:hypothetical protein
MWDLHLDGLCGEMLAHGARIWQVQGFLLIQHPAMAMMSGQVDFFSMRVHS